MEVVALSKLVHPMLVRSMVEVWEGPDEDPLQVVL